MSGGGESPASCTRARPRILRIPHLAHPASCASRISHTPTPPHLAHAHAHSAGRGSQDFGTSACSAHAAQAPRSTAPQRELHPPQRVAPAAARVAPAAAQTYCCRAGRNEGRKATRLHQGSPGLCCRFTRLHQGSPGLCCRLTRVHLARPAAPDVLLSLLPTGRNDGTQGHQFDQV